MSSIKIDKGIPLPSARTRNGGLADAVRQMEIGDSALLPAEKRGYLSALAKRNSITLVTRKVDAKNVRVWRTA